MIVTRNARNINIIFWWATQIGCVNWMVPGLPPWQTWISRMGQSYAQHDTQIIIAAKYFGDRPVSWFCLGGQNERKKKKKKKTDWVPCLNDHWLRQQNSRYAKPKTKKKIIIKLCVHFELSKVNERTTTKQTNEKKSHDVNALSLAPLLAITQRIWTTTKM